MQNGVVLSLRSLKCLVGKGCNVALPLALLQNLV